MDQLEFHFGSGTSGQVDLIDFLDSQKQLASSVQVEYPTVFRKGNDSESLWVDVQGKVVSHAAFVERTFKHPLFQFQVGLIGSVATDPEFRGRGLATSLVQQALERLRKRGCLAAVLWSNQESFYTPIGFVPSGLEQELIFEKAFEPQSKGIVSEGISDSDIQALCQLYVQQDVGLERTVEKFGVLLSVPRLRCFVLRRMGTIVAYAVLNKGSDFSDVLHEWAGSLDDVATIVSWLKNRDYQARTLRLIAPGHRNLGGLLSLATVVKQGTMGMIRALNRPALKSIYLSHLRNQSIKAEWGDELKIAGNLVETRSEADFIRAIFGIGGAVATSKASASKLPFFIWGLDSI